MQGLRLNTPEGILELYNHFNGGGQWRPKQVQYLNDYSGNVLLKCEVSNSFGGPYLDSGLWEIPVNVRDCVFSWNFLVQGLFDKFDIPCNKSDFYIYDEYNYPKDLNGFTKMLEKNTKRGKGRKFMNAVNKKYTTLAKILFENPIGIEYHPRHPHNTQGEVFRKKDEFEAIIKFDVYNHPKNSLKENLLKNFTQNRDTLVISSSKVRGIIPRNY